ncbi:MAG TPA: hypothetical protein VMW42_14025 [Desulfatiglandales bacterium]|nr:hypothetical protein [Desulfatiglandales bacterium]
MQNPEVSLIMFGNYISETLQNPTIPVTLKKRVDFSEVTGGRALSFRNLSMGETTGIGIKI